MIQTLTEQVHAQLQPNPGPSATLDGVPRIWLGPVGPGMQVRHFRKLIDAPRAADRVHLSLFAELRYHVWINGVYVGRGPVFHHPHRRPVATYDVTEHWRAGENVVAVTVYTPGVVLHNGIATDRPGLCARITADSGGGERQTWVSDDTWRATDQTGWHRDLPRRGWALPPIECVDAKIAPHGWQWPGFDDTDWPAAEVADDGANPIPTTWIDPGLPPLTYGWKGVEQLLGVYWASPRVPPLSADQTSDIFGSLLLSELWIPITRTTDLRPGSIDPEGTLTFRGLLPNRGIAVCLDLGAQQVGQIVFDCECDTAGTIDIGWAEVLRHDRPETMHKETSYADRLIARPGPQTWEPLQFTGARYLSLTLRGFSGTVRFRRLGVRTSEPDLAWPGSFDSDDTRLNAIWDLCVRTARIGTQEGLMDCPSREQAPYLGDGHLVAAWIGMLTGDYGHWRYLLREAFARQSSNGLLRDAVFSGVCRSLIDYSLLTVIAVRDYLRRTGDADTARTVLPGCRRVIDFFEAAREGGPLVQTHVPEVRPPVRWEYPCTSAELEPIDAAVFIDHGGAGHNIDDPSIDRRGTNAAINAAYVMGLRALAELESAVGRSDAAAPLHRRADEIADVAGRTFWSEREGAFIDGVREGKQSPQVSQQTNTWAVMAGFCPPERRPGIFGRILRPDDQNLARSGPYFWAYMLPVMAELGMHERALDSIRALWGRMLDGGATTLWETFAGDGLDTWCHPWAGAPIPFLLRDVLGLDVLDRPADDLALRPRPDLLGRGQGRIVSPWGPVSIAWRREGDGVVCSGELPEGTRATLYDPSGQALRHVEGTWEVRLPS